MPSIDLRTSIVHIMIHFMLLIQNNLMSQVLYFLVKKEEVSNRY